MFMAELRQIKSGDWELLRSVRLAALADAPEAFSSTFETESILPETTWRERALNSSEGVKSLCVVAREGSNSAGMATGLSDPDDGTRCHLVSMWVAPAFRGSGVAQSLVDAIAEWAARSGASQLLAGVKARNERALAFYHKVGFKAYYGPCPDHPATNSCQHLIVRRV